MKLNVSERLLVLNILPKIGNIECMKAVESLMLKVGLTKEEEKEWEVKRVDQNSINWNAEKAKEKEMVFSKEEKELIAKVLTEFNKNEKLDLRFISIYEKFTKG